ETALLYGNVVKATHGETIKDETLGSGDGSQASQTFDLKKSPVTFTPDATADRGAKNSLQVMVNGIRWQEAPNFFGRGPDERIYATSIDDDDEMHVEFGDGVYGARLPTGVSNVHAKYRKGWGKEGSVVAGKLTTLLDAKPGLKSVTNPAASFGWADPETLGEARQNAPTTVLTFDRAVSLLDFENLARSYPGVGKARAAWVWNDEQQVVQLTCAASDGASIIPIRSNLLAYLDARRDPNRELEIIDFTPVGITLHAFIVADPNTDSATVLAAAQAAAGAGQLPDETYGFFAFERLNLDEDIHLSEVYASLQNVAGVVAVHIDVLHRKDDTSVMLQNIVPIGPAELAMIEAATDVVIELKGAL
ncbi:MAG TPA: putative baseplate assembly protein, partial [Anaerolineae bacterium]